MKTNQILIIYSFLICLFLTIVGIFSAKSAAQLFNSFIFLPLIFFFGTKILHFPKKSISPLLPGNKLSTFRTVKTPLPSPTLAEEPEIIPGVADNDKRLFLKLIGSTSFSLLLMSLFTKDAQASFFGSTGNSSSSSDTVKIKDSAGNKIDPAEKSPTDGYAITNIDDAGSPIYYGFVKKTGAWYILNQDSNNVYLYTKGDSNFSTNWGNRASLTYDYFNNIFG